MKSEPFTQKFEHALCCICSRNSRLRFLGGKVQAEIKLLHGSGCCRIHYQRKQPQGKLVRVVRGKVFDVAVDVRRNSPAVGKWVGFELSEGNHSKLWIPPGFAHGFLMLSDTADFLYKATDYYAPVHERAIRWDDPQLDVACPMQELRI